MKRLKFHLDVGKWLSNPLLVSLIVRMSVVTKTAKKPKKTENASAVRSIIEEAGFTIAEFEILAYEDFYTEDFDGDDLVETWVACQPHAMAG